MKSLLALCLCLPIWATHFMIIPLQVNYNDEINQSIADGFFEIMNSAIHSVSEQNASYAVQVVEELRPTWYHQSRIDDFYDKYDNNASFLNTIFEYTNIDILLLSVIHKRTYDKNSSTTKIKSEIIFHHQDNTSTVQNTTLATQLSYSTDIGSLIAEDLITTQKQITKQLLQILETR